MVSNKRIGIVFFALAIIVSVMGLSAASSSSMGFTESFGDQVSGVAIQLTGAAEILDAAGNVVLIPSVTESLIAPEGNIADSLALSVSWIVSGNEIDFGSLSVTIKRSLHIEVIGTAADHNRIFKLDTFNESTGTVSDSVNILDEVIAQIGIENLDDGDQIKFEFVYEITAVANSVYGEYLLTQGRKGFYFVLAWDAPKIELEIDSTSSGGDTAAEEWDPITDWSYTGAGGNIWTAESIIGGSGTTAGFFLIAVAFTIIGFFFLKSKNEMIG